MANPYYRVSSSEITLDNARISVSDGDVIVTFPNGERLSLRDTLELLESMKDKIKQLEEAYIEEKLLGEEHGK